MYVSMTTCLQIICVTIRQGTSINGTAMNIINYTNDYDMNIMIEMGVTPYTI